MKKVVMFKADDGSFWETEDEALNRDKFNALVEGLMGAGVTYTDEAQDIARWLQERYTLTPKEKT